MAYRLLSGCEGDCVHMKITYFSQTFISLHFLPWPPTSIEAPSSFPMHSILAHPFDIHEAHFFTANDIRAIYAGVECVAHKLSIDWERWFSCTCPHATRSCNSIGAYFLYFIAFGYALPVPPPYKQCKFFAKLTCNRRQLVHTLNWRSCATLQAGVINQVHAS